MSGYFPNMNHDELLFSILARYHYFSGNINIRSTTRELYAKNSICAVVDFPCNLDMLVENIPLNNTDSNMLIERHTLLPYYKPFLSDKCYIELKAMMKSYNNINKIHMSLGIIASRISYPEKLRYCEKCYKQEVTKYGQAYWHRVHQLPGVFICDIHKCFLKHSFVEMHGRKNKHEFITLDKGVINRNSIDIPSDVNRDLLLFISKETSLILNGIGELPNIIELKEIIKYQLKEKGYITFTNRFRFKELIKDINRFCGISTLKLLQVDLDDNISETWIHKFVRGKASKKEHPLRYMILFYFLGKISLENIGKRIGCTEACIFKAPFPCLNKASHHYREFIIDNVEIKRESKTGLPVGTFTCVCGFSYSRRGPDTSGDDKFRIGRIKNFGNLWFIKLDELLKESISMREIARRLGVDVNTVIKYSKIEQKNLNIKSVDKSSNFGLNNLKKEIPDKRKNITSKTKVDWEKRDSDLASIIYKTSIDLINSEYHGRVTKSLLRRIVGRHKSLLEKKTNKLFLSKIVLIMLSESYSEYQDRRIKRVIKDMQSNNIEIKKWKIIRKACLGSTISNVINEKIDEYLDRNN